MKKKIIAFLLSMVMILSCIVLTSCSEENDNSNLNATTRTPVTLNFYLVTDDNTTEAGVKSMEEAFNEFTESNFTTHVTFTMVKSSEYEQKLYEKIEKVSKEPTQTVSTAIEYYTDDKGITKLKYPELVSDQLDIILVTSTDMLLKLNGDGVLKSMDSAVRDTYPSLLSYYNSSIISSAKIGKSLYAIPNNHVIGEYTYLVISRAAAKLVYNDSISETSDFSTQGNVFTGYASFLNLADKLAKYNSDNSTNIVPLASKFDYPNLINYSTDGKKSLYVYDSEVLDQNNVLDNTQYIDYLKLNAVATANNYYSTSATDVGFYSETNQSGYAMKVVKGNYAVSQNYPSDKYIVKVLGNPTLTTDDVCSTMYGVTKYTKNFDRAMEIINALETNTDLHNILQYGQSGVNYEIDSTNLVTKIGGIGGTNGNIYSMNPLYTGNFFLTYACKDINLYPDEITVNGQDQLKFVYYGRLQNNDLVSGGKTKWAEKLASFESGDYSVIRSINSFYPGTSGSSDYDMENNMLANAKTIGMTYLYETLARRIMTNRKVMTNYSYVADLIKKMNIDENTIGDTEKTNLQLFEEELKSDNYKTVEELDTLINEYRAKYGLYNKNSDFYKISELIDYANTELSNPFFAEIESATTSAEVDSIVAKYKNLFKEEGTVFSSVSNVITSFLGSI